MAKSVGAKYYFNGKPCKRGHVSPRYAHGSCVACKEEDRSERREENILYLREWRKANPDKCQGYHEKLKESGYHDDYYRRNRDEILERGARWRENNPEKVQEINKRSYEKHKGERRTKARAKYAEDPSYDKGRAIIYREKNRDKVAEQSMEWRRSNPEKVRVYDRNKKLKRKGAEGSHTPEDVQKLRKYQGYKCAECKSSIADSYHVDHIMPLSKGGTNYVSNLQILCPACNMEKHAADPFEFARKKGRLL